MNTLENHTFGDTYERIILRVHRKSPVRNSLHMYRKIIKTNTLPPNPPFLKGAHIRVENVQIYLEQTIAPLFCIMFCFYVHSLDVNTL